MDEKLDEACKQTRGAITEARAWLHDVESIVAAMPQGSGDRMRAVRLVRTKLDEAELWLRKVNGA